MVFIKKTKYIVCFKTLYGFYNIGVKGCKALAPVLPQMTALEMLFLSGSEIGDIGKTMMREAWKNAGKDRRSLCF